MTFDEIVSRLYLLSVQLASDRLADMVKELELEREANNAGTSKDR